MSGRIKLLKDDEPTQPLDIPQLGYQYENPRGHDSECGTFGLNSFQLPHAECPKMFVCDTADVNDDFKQFAECIDSMNCAMMAGMTSSVKGSADETALFIHQMIPHHQNAVNMAKASTLSLVWRIFNITFLIQAIYSDFILSGIDQDQYSCMCWSYRWRNWAGSGLCYGSGLT